MTQDTGGWTFAGSNRPIMYVIEVLTLRVWVCSVLPRLLWRRLRVRTLTDRCDVIDASRLALAVARACTWATGVVVERLPFRMRDIVDEEGLLLRLRIVYQDLAEVQADALRDPAFRTIVEEYKAQDRMVAYLGRAISSVTPLQWETLWRALFTIHVCRWRVRREPDRTTQAVFFLQRRPWLRAIARYAAQQGILTVPVSPAFHAKTWLRRVLPLEVIVGLRWLRAHWYQRVVLRSASTTLNPPPRPTRQGKLPRLAVEYYGHLNLTQPQRYSDLFFWQQSALPAKDVLVMFHVPRDPLDEHKWTELSQHGFSVVVLQPAATTLRGAPVFTPRPHLRREYAPPRKLGPAAGSVEARWLRQQARSYLVLRDTWEELFATTGVKVYVSWFKYDGSHCAIADALQRVGGVMAIYQRAYEYHPSVETTIAADVVFGFSQAVAELERRSNSVIPYHITTGYLGDHRFSLLRQEARRVRQALHERGAQQILALFDENSGEDPRWHTGHDLQREQYAFLLEKLLAYPWLGLVIKPKVPSTLRRRLGPVAALLQRAEATGRCLVYEGGVLGGSHPPSEAALAADLAIHGHLCAATAGLEAALAGVPTLLVDREGWARSPLYRLGVGRVVFTEWQALWNTCLEHWKRPDGIPGFGDWSPILDELDPFRDGRAAERMGTYLTWLLEGFKAGLNRETVMADAAQRYVAQWGNDKVTQVHPARGSAMACHPHASVTLDREQPLQEVSPVADVA